MRTELPLAASRGASHGLAGSLLILLLLSALALPGEGMAQERADATLIRNVRVFDGEGATAGRDVLIEGGRITAVGAGLRAPAGAVVVDGTDRTLLPGLIDAHTHSFGDALREALVFGVTTHLDMFSHVPDMQAAKAEQERGEANHRADLFSSGTLVTAPGGHGTQFGIEIPTLTSTVDADSFVARRLAEGSDWIKVVYDDGTAYGRRIPTIDRPTLRAVIVAAHARQKQALVHISDAASARVAIEEGADGLVHLFAVGEVDPRLAELALEHGVFVVPTLTVLQSVTGVGGGASLVDDPEFAPYLLPVRRSSLAQGFPVPPGTSRSMDVALETVRLMHASGVPILAGTDAPNPGTAYGVAMHREVELLVEAGLTPTEALRAATSVPAREFGLADRGRIEPGLRADLLLVEGDPTTDITATRRIVAIWKAGQAVDREAFAREVAELAAERRTGAAALRDGLVSDFESGQLHAELGSWIPSPDSYAGGRSTGEVTAAVGGAGGSGYSMRIQGTISDAVPYAWYGAMWMPSRQQGNAMDLSATPSLSFQTRGDGQVYRVLVFTESGGMMPAQQTFTAPDHWREVTFAWSDFGTDGRDVIGVVIAGGPHPGPFDLRIDDFRLR